MEFEDKYDEAIEKADYLIDIDDQVVKTLLEGLITYEEGDFVKNYIISFFNDNGYVL